MSFILLVARLISLPLTHLCIFLANKFVISSSLRKSKFGGQLFGLIELLASLLRWWLPDIPNDLLLLVCNLMLLILGISIEFKMILDSLPSKTNSKYILSLSRFSFDFWLSRLYLYSYALFSASTIVSYCWLVLRWPTLSLILPLQRSLTWYPVPEWKTLQFEVSCQKECSNENEGNAYFKEYFLHM